jgi:toxin ParE1/3/4
MEGSLTSAPRNRIRWTEKALQYLEAAADYIAEDSPQAAEAFVKRVFSGTMALAQHPEIGRAGRCKGTRELVVTNTPYIVAYRVKGEQIEILRVLHGARKWPIKI